MIYINLTKEAETACWGIIELQGDLKPKNNVDYHSQFVGDLVYTNDGTPTLIIGQHILVGKEITLEKPYAVLERQRFDYNGEPINNVKKMEDVYETEYKIRAIVTKKLLFKTRPKPIVKGSKISTS